MATPKNPAGPSNEARARSAATRRRRADERLAAQLRSRGWTVTPKPEARADGPRAGDDRAALQDEAARKLRDSLAETARSAGRLGNPAFGPHYLLSFGDGTTAASLADELTRLAAAVAQAQNDLALLRESMGPASQ